MSTNHTFAREPRLLTNWDEDDDGPWIRPLETPITIQLSPLFSKQKQTPEPRAAVYAAAVATFAVGTACVLALFA